MVRAGIAASACKPMRAPQVPHKSAGTARPMVDSARLRLLAQARAQARNRLAVQLADARLGHAENVADLAQVELFLIVQRHDLLLALRQIFDRLDERLAHALVEQTLERLLGPVGEVVSVGGRPLRCSRRAMAVSILRRFLRRPRGSQSDWRRLSSIAPRMRCTA